MNKLLMALGYSLCLLQPCYAMEGDSEFLQELRFRFTQPQDVDSIDGYEEGQPFLHEAITRADTGALLFLIDQQHAHTDIANAAGDFPLHLAVRMRKQEIIELLLDKHADINARDRGLMTPLHLAVMGKLRSVVVLLLTKHADPDAQNTEGETPLHLAVYGKLQRVVDLLLGYNARVNRMDRAGNTPLHIAVASRLQPIMTSLLGHAADVGASDANGNTSLHLAVKGDNVTQDSVQLLLDHVHRPEIVNAKDGTGNTPLHIAVTSRLQPIVKSLLGHAADVGALDANGNTSLHLAIKGDHVTQDSVQLLLDHVHCPEIVNAKDSAGNTLLHIAVTSRLQPIVKSLLDKAADVGALDAHGNTPLHIAITHRLQPIVASLLAKAADVSALDAASNTPLHLAVSGHNVSLDLVQLLLAHGHRPAIVNVKNSAGNTPLHIAVSNGEIDIDLIKLLLDNGASPLEQNVQKLFARDLAIRAEVKYLVDKYFQIWLIEFKDYISSNIESIVHKCKQGYRFLIRSKEPSETQALLSSSETHAALPDKEQAPQQGSYCSVQ